MTEGKPWTAEEEEHLRFLVEVKTITRSYGLKDEEKPQVIMRKCKRLGLEVVSKNLGTTTEVKLPKDLPIVEQALRVEIGALTTC